MNDAVPPAGVTHASPLRGDGGAVRGVGGLAFSAEDAGGGVYRWILSVDGREVGRAVVASNGGRCADVEPDHGDAYEFGAPQPCPLRTDGTATFDTQRLRDGAHAVRLEVEDAAGNATVLHDGHVTTHNAPIATVAPAIGGDARVGGALAADAGAWDGAPWTLDHRWLRCDADGAACAPIAGAGAATYAPTATDAYRRLVVEVTAENAAGTTVARSQPSAPIADEQGRTSPGGPVADPGPDPGADPPTSDPRPDPAGSGPQAGAGSSAPPIDTQGVGGLTNPLAGAGGHAPNGDNASRTARIAIGLRRAGAGARRARRIRIRAGRRATLVGRLADERDRPIGGARLTVAWRIPGRGWVARGRVTTDADGRLETTLRPGPSRLVRVTYFPFADSRRFIASATVRLEVTSPVTIRASRKRVGPRGVVTLRGVAGAKPAPAGGVLVALHGWQAGWGWRTFRTVRANRSGRWSTRYRFRSSAGRFRFRASVPEQGGHPYAPGRSRAVAVAVR